MPAAGGRRPGPRPRPPAGEPPRPEQRRPRRLHDRLLRADRRPDAPAGSPPADRRPRRRARRREHDGRGRSTSRGWTPAAALPRPTCRLHAKVGYHQPCHLRALDVGTPGSRPDPPDPGAGRRVHRPRLLGHGRDVRPGPRATSAPRSAPVAACATACAIADIELGSTECGTCRMQMEQGLHQADPPPSEAAEPRLRPEPVASRRLQGTEAPPRHRLSRYHPTPRFAVLAKQVLIGNPTARA